MDSNILSPWAVWDICRTPFTHRQPRTSTKAHFACHLQLHFGVPAYRLSMERATHWKGQIWTTGNPLSIKPSNALKSMAVLKIFSRRLSLYSMKKDISTPALSTAMGQPLQPRKAVTTWDSVDTSIWKKTRLSLSTISHGLGVRYPQIGAKL